MDVKLFLFLYGGSKFSKLYPVLHTESCYAYITEDITEKDNSIFCVWQIFIINWIVPFTSCENSETFFMCLCSSNYVHSRPDEIMATLKLCATLSPNICCAAIISLTSTKIPPQL